MRKQNIRKNKIRNGLVGLAMGAMSILPNFASDSQAQDLSLNDYLLRV